MKQYSITVTALANARQEIEVWADSEEEAREKAVAIGRQGPNCVWDVSHFEADTVESTLARVDYEDEDEGEV